MLHLRSSVQCVLDRCPISLANQGIYMVTSKRYVETTSSEKSTDPLPLSKIKGFKDYPFLGTLPSVFFNKKFRTDRIHEFWRSAFDEHGPVVRLRYPWSPRSVILIYRPEDIVATYKATQHNPIRYGFSSLRHIRQNAEGNYFGNSTGLLPENDEEWKRVRTKVQGPCLKLQNLYKYLPALDQVVLDFMDRIQDFQDAYGEMPPNFLEEIYKWAIESVSLMTLNRRLGCLDPNADPNSIPQQMIDTITQIFICMAETEVNVKIWKYIPTPKIRKMQKSGDKFLRLLRQSLKETEETKENSKVLDFSFLDILRNIPGLTEKDITTFVLDLYSGGVDTTSHSLSFTLYLLARNPRVQKKLQQEVDEILGDGEEPFSEKHHKSFIYLKKVIKESLRLFPVVVGTPRMLEQDVVLSGYLIPKGNAVYCINMVTSRHEDVFPRANEFLPERWERDRPLGTFHPFASIPFAQGPRMCIGKRIAENELYVFLARVMHRYNVEYHYEDIEIETRLVGLPSRPLRFQFLPRSK